MFLLRQSARPGQAGLAANVRRTLDAMAAGGIHDHVGGGFHRYATDRQWHVPHYEKMLTDQAQLMELYAEAYRQTRHPADAAVVADIGRFVARELTAPAGGFATSLDADSGGEEGAYYTWAASELREALPRTTAADDFCRRYGLRLLNPRDNDPRPLVRTARPSGLLDAAADEYFRRRLRAARDRRARPACDTTITAGGTGLMIAGYAAAGRALADARYTRAAERAAKFALARLKLADGKLARVYGGPPGAKPAARGPAFLDDYSYLTHGLLTLHDATGDDRWLAAARELTDAAVVRFADPKAGGFYRTPADGEPLFVRGKDFTDGPVPSPNGLTARNLARLATKTGAAEYRGLAETTVRAFGVSTRIRPDACPTLLDALDMLLAPAGPK